MMVGLAAPQIALVVGACAAVGYIGGWVVGEGVEKGVDWFRDNYVRYTFGKLMKR